MCSSDLQEIEAREDALARASSHAEEVVNKAATELSRQWSLFSIMWKHMKKKNKGKRDELAQREQRVAAREAELTEEAKNLELQGEKLKTEVEQRLAEAEKRHQITLDEKARDAREARQKEEEARRAAEDAEKDLLAERDATRKLRDQAKLDG